MCWSQELLAALWFRHKLGTKGKRNLAIGLGAVTAYGLIKKKKTVAIVGGVDNSGLSFLQEVG